VYNSQPEREKPDLVSAESSEGREARDVVVAKLRAAAARFYGRASLEEVAEMSRLVRTLLLRRRLLPERRPRTLP